MKVWDELVSTALLGTEREPLPPMHADGELGTALAALKGDQTSGRQFSKEDVLLRAAALIELYKRAGYTPSSSGTIPPPVCPEETTRQCSPKAGGLLSTLLNEVNETILCEWIACARNNGKRIPDILLPPLLELGLTKKKLASELLLSAGHRMRWLAKMNSDWAYITAGVIDTSDPVRDWETGELSERLAALRSLRVHEPDRARDMMKTSWAQEPAELRAQFTQELQLNLSMSDEPFLEEQALDDKRKEVRVVAQRLLALLPESRLSQRMVARAVPHIKFVKNLTSHAYEFDYSLVFTPDMARDGITTIRQTDVGEKTDMLRQIVSFIHPEYWSKHFDADARKLVDTAAKKIDSQTILLQGWHRAAAFHRSAEWAQYLLPFVLTDFESLLECIPQERKEALLLNILRTVGGRIKSSAETLHMVRAFVSEEGVLGVECSRYLLHAFKAECTSDPYYNNPIAVMLPSLALKLAPSLAPEAVTGWKEQLFSEPFVRRSLDQFMETVQFRHDMYKALEE